MSHLSGAQRAKHKQARAEDDWYVENHWASEQLFAQVRFIGPIHDPCCGEGRIVRAARAAGYEATGADIIDRGFPGVEIIDFLTDWRPRRTLAFNAKYQGQAREAFVTHALEVAVEAVATIVPTSFECGQDRFWNLYTRCPPSLILGCAQRVNMPPGGIGADENGGTEDYVWLIWSRGRLEWRRNGGSAPLLPGKWWLSRDGTIFDWLKPLTLPKGR